MNTDSNTYFKILWKPYINNNNNNNNNNNTYLDTESEKNNFESIKIRIYDAGDIRGFLLNEGTMNEKWFLYKIISRTLFKDNNIEEKGYLLSEDKIPLHFFSNKIYDAKQNYKLNTNSTISNLQILLPQWELQIDFFYHLETPSVLLVSPLPSLLGLPPQDPQPLEQPQKLSLPETQKLHPAKLRQSPQKLLNKNKVSSKNSAASTS